MTDKTLIERLRTRNQFTYGAEGVLKALGLEPVAYRGRQTWPETPWKYGESPVPLYTEDGTYWRDQLFTAEQVCRALELVIQRQEG